MTRSRRAPCIVQFCNRLQSLAQAERPIHANSRMASVDLRAAISFRRNRCCKFEGGDGGRLLKHAAFNLTPRLKRTDATL